MNASASAPDAPPGRRSERAALLATLYPLGLVAISVIHAILPARSGPLAISQILAPHLFLVALLLVPLATLPGTRILRMALLAAVTVFAIRFGSGAISLPVAPAEGGRRDVVATWNLLADGRDDSRTMGALRALDASLVGLQELSERMAGAIEADVALIARYPYRVMAPRPGVRGMGLLSAYPVLASGQLADPPLLWATLDLGVGRRLTVVDAHPLPARMRGLVAVPLDFDPTARDAAIGRIREVVDPFLSSGEPLLLLGDFNVTDRERAYAELTRDWPMRNGPWVPGRRHPGVPASRSSGRSGCCASTTCSPARASAHCRPRQTAQRVAVTTAWSGVSSSFPEVAGWKLVRPARREGWCRAPRAAAST